MSAGNNRVRDLLKKVEPIGWRFDGITNGSHVRLVHTSGRKIVTSATPGDRRAMKNAEALLKRIAREAQQQ